MIFGWDFLGQMCFIFETRKSHPFCIFLKNRKIKKNMVTKKYKYKKSPDHKNFLSHKNVFSKLFSTFRFWTFLKYFVRKKGWM
jgi:hypothetical protein